ncbi:MAG: MreB/Mrl family cell shape determining protein [Candidatus Aminicenantes bacterium]|nr:MreB/Mrl family cell shape determining protein [Candidatus Aminicenantes bacterium]
MSLLNRFKNRLFCDLAIDLGTANTLVYLKGRGIIVQEPSMVVVNKQTGKLEAVGKRAKEMLGKTPANVMVIKPMRDGVIADFEIAEKMLDFFIKMSTTNRGFLTRPKIVIGIPSGITQVEKRAVKDVALKTKTSEVYLIAQSVSAALGADLPISDPTGSMIVDIGGGTTDIAVISLNGIVFNHSTRIAGHEMDEAIIQYLKRKYNLLIGERSAERVKERIGSAYPLDEPMTMEIKGRDLREGIPKAVVIGDQEVREALDNIVSSIIDAIKYALERIPPELSADLIDCGIILTGGSALLKNLDKRISEETHLPVFITDDPLTTVVLGAGKMLDDLDLLKKISLT